MKIANIFKLICLASLMLSVIVHKTTAQSQKGNIPLKMALKLTLSGLDGWAQSVKFSPDGKIVLAGSPSNDKSGGAAKLWDVATGRLTHTLKWNSGAFQSAIFSPDGKFIAIKTGQDGGPEYVDAEDQISIVDSQTGNLVRVFNSPYGSLGQFFGMVAFSSDSKFIICSVVYGEHVGKIDSRKLEFWDIQTGKKKTTLEDLEGLIEIAQDGKIAVAESCSKSGTTITIRDLYSKKLKQTIFTDAGQEACSSASVTFSTDKMTLVSGDWFDVITRPATIYNVQTGKLKFTLQGAKPPFAFSPDGKTLASRGVKKGAILLWDLNSRKITQELIGHTDSILALDFSSDGKMLVSGSQDRSVKIWE